MLCLCFAVAAPAAAQTLEQKAQALITAYADYLSGFDGTFLIWKDGTKMRFGEGREDKPLDEVFDRPDIADMFRWTYAFGGSGIPAAPESDPGRIRNEAFFEKIYGACRKQPPGGCSRVTCSVEGHLDRIPWVPKSGGGVMKATSINGVSAKLRLVSGELEALGPKFARYLAPSGGSYAPRCIARTTRLSVHSFGIAFDINPRYGQYWQYGLPAALGEREVWERRIPLVYKNKIPLEIVKVFEKHGFIWGGKWYHFDGMHFEYRPEFLALKSIVEK
ncbi:MAG: M15 family metallopeptidase [Rhodomicrobium sp.]|nr:M15 family metallopeptidase [Rhodomicrobium sp.]